MARGTNLATDVIALEKIVLLQSKGLPDVQLLKIIQLDNLPVLELTESLAKRNPPFITALGDLAESTVIMQGYKSDATLILNDMAKHSGLRNPEDLYSFIRNNCINATEGSKPGWKYELDVYFDSYKNNPNEVFNFSKKVPATSGNPPIKEVDFIGPTKLTEVKTWDNLNTGPGNTILMSLFDKLGKQVKKIDFNHPDNAGIINRRGRGKILTNSHPSYNMDWDDLKIILHDTYNQVGTNLDELTELIIENAKGKHTFQPTHWQNP